MKTVFSYCLLSGILIGGVATSAAAQSAPANQGGQKKEKTQVVIVDKKDHGKNGTRSGSTRPPRQ